MRPFLFHLCPLDLRDATIYPLNELRTRHPELYLRERRKWEGRESVLDVEIPHLGCTWGDTVNLATIDPRRLIAAREEIGLPRSRLLARRLVRIPMERIAGRAAVVYDCSRHWINSRPGAGDADASPLETDFEPFDSARYEELTAVPPAHTDYLREQRRAEEAALGFVFVPHVLVRGAIPVSDLVLESV